MQNHYGQRFSLLFLVSYLFVDAKKLINEFWRAWFMTVEQKEPPGLAGNMLKPAEVNKKETKETYHPSCSQGAANRSLPLDRKFWQSEQHGLHVRLGSLHTPSFQRLILSSLTDPLVVVGQWFPWVCLRWFLCSHYINHYVWLFFPGALSKSKFQTMHTERALKSQRKTSF